MTQNWPHIDLILHCAILVSFSNVQFSAFVNSFEPGGHFWKKNKNTLDDGRAST